MLPKGGSEVSKQKLSRRAFLKLGGLTAGSALLTSVIGGCQKPEATVDQAATKPPPTAPPAAKPVDIRLTAWGDVTDKQVYDNIVADMAEVEPNINVTVEQYPGGYYEKIQANFAAGSSADVIYFQGWSWQPFSDNGVLASLDEFIEADGAQALWPDIKNYTVNTDRGGKKYMSVADTGSCIMFYVKEMFDKVGIPYPTDDWTYDDFKTMVEQLTYEEDGVQHYGYAQASGWNGTYLRSIHWMRMAGALEWDQVEEPTQANWLQDEIIDALQFTVVDTIANGWCPTPDVIDGGGVSTSTGRVAMNCEGPWTLGHFHGENEAVPGGTAFDVVSMPKGATGMDHTIAEVHGHVMAKSSKESQAAWKVMKFIMSDQGQKRIADGGRMCSTPEYIEKLWVPVAQETYQFENGNAFADAMRTGGTPVVAGAGANYDAIAGAGAPVSVAWDAMIFGTSAEEALTEANPKIQKILDDYLAAKG
jgi:multiple sugar transport system substrate-binding protein